uniref:Integrin_alpha2 domain-containing protein n=1 Tax=Globodera pallida TaxID=36090 RepID=A0A183CMJ2_GLOPA
FSKGNRLVVDEVDIGPQVVHVYTITNRGPFYARNVSLTVSWPLQLSPAGPPTSSNRQLAPGGWALYALEDPLVRHNGQFRRCASPTRAQKTINPMGVYNDETLKLDYQLAKRQRPKRATGRTDRTETEAEAAPATSIFDSGRILRKEVEESSGAKVRIADINCKDGSALCVPLHCHFDYIGRNDSVLIEIRARLWNFTFSADYRAIDYVAISSEGFIEVDPSQGILEDVTNNFARVTTHAYPDRPQQEGQVRVWMLLLAVLIGLALLGLLVLASLNFRALLNSSSVEKDPTNNEWSAEVQLIKEADLQLEGASRPAIVRFSKGNRLVVDEVDIGPQVVHVYTITNRGPFYARNVSLTVSWPLQLSPAGPPTSSTRQLAPGGWALYALEDPLVRHNGQFRRCKDRKGPRDERIGPKQRPRRLRRPQSSTADASLRKEVEESSGAKVRIADINCKDGSALCVPLHCHFDYIGRNDSVLIEIRARLWNFTFSADYRAIDYVAISSEGFIEVDPSQGILEDVTNNFARVTTHAYPDRPQQEGQVRVWMLLLAVLIGLALLGLLVLCCSRLGFFKRKRPESLLHQAHYQHNREYDG